MDTFPTTYDFMSTFTRISVFHWFQNQTLSPNIDAVSSFAANAYLKNQYDFANKTLSHKSFVPFVLAQPEHRKRNSGRNIDRKRKPKQTGSDSASRQETEKTNKHGAGGSISNHIFPSIGSFNHTFAV